MCSALPPSLPAGVRGHFSSPRLVVRYYRTQHCWVHVHARMSSYEYKRNLIRESNRCVSSAGTASSACCCSSGQWESEAQKTHHNFLGADCSALAKEAAFQGAELLVFSLCSRSLLLYDDFSSERAYVATHANSPGGAELQGHNVGTQRLLQECSIAM